MSKKKILVIDDEVNFSNLLKINLEDIGEYEVKAIYKGSEGYEAAREFCPDMIIIDVVLKDADGRDVLSLIKSDSQFQHVSVIILSAVPLKQILEKHPVLLGNTLILSKPITLAMLVEHIHQQLKKSENG